MPKDLAETGVLACMTLDVEDEAVAMLAEQAFERAGAKAASLLVARADRCADPHQLQAVFGVADPEIHHAAGSPALGPQIGGNESLKVETTVGPAMPPLAVLAAKAAIAANRKTLVLRPDEVVETARHACSLGSPGHRENLVIAARG